MNINKFLISFFIFVFIYSVTLFFLAPVVDHTFPVLNRKKSNYRIMLEIIVQVFVITLIFYGINGFIYYITKHKLCYKSNLISLRHLFKAELIIDIIASIMFIGLQTNLIQKVNYISYEHPFRFFTFFQENTK